MASFWSDSTSRTSISPLRSCGSGSISVVVSDDESDEPSRMRFRVTKKIKRRKDRRPNFYFRMLRNISKWWFIFLPLWIFHIIVARGRFSLPAPVPPHWAPCHTVIAVTLLITFELLLCIYLDSRYGYGIPLVNLKVLCVPPLLFEIIVLVDNFRMCRVLMPSDDENITDEAIWDTLPHFWVAISMVFYIAAIIFTLLK